ncbi:hypothetical protein Sru01_44460 [Sphaerisporangium rufum]|uniref:Calpain catalytic domain-containing protein n=1 Tax=Sphaerisporangium rufum TaxID=1381558 RepID=A0A919R4D2_9ACTN|nr:C2 family cysteine protease [Sphaerisporangium rufum]GII79464.1 hypothetical protein Sru01_44460 [Sphaerisporangium rufum]
MAPREDDGGGDFAGIDPVLMRSMIKDLEGAKGLVEEHVPGLKDAFSRVGLSTKPIGTLAGVAGWIGGELGMLNRRQRMAEQLSKENDQFGFTGAMVQTEWEGFFKSPAEAEAKAKELAGTYQEPEGFPDDAWEQIRKYQSDPDFARALLKQLGPEKAAFLVNRARGENDDGARLAAFSTVMAVASHQGVIDDAWLGKFAKGTDGMPDLSGLAAVIQHGTWNKDTLVAIGNRGLRGTLGGDTELAASFLDGLARNPMAANQVYAENFDMINRMISGDLPGWLGDDAGRGDPLGRFVTAATVEAREVGERMRPPGDLTWCNPADPLISRVLGQTQNKEPLTSEFDGVRQALAGLAGLAGQVPVPDPRLDVEDAGRFEYGMPGTLPDPSMPLYQLGVSQGQLGDCYFLAAVAGRLRQDPNFLTKRMTRNADGTYTVTFFRDGAPVPVTVTAAVPMWKGTQQDAFVSPPLLAIYEKAYAQFKGLSSFEEIEGGFVVDPWPDIDGKKVGELDDLSYANLKKLSDAKVPMTVSTPADGIFDDDHRTGPGAQLVTKHVYSVEDVFIDKNGVETVRLVNPWGAGASAPHQVDVPLSWIKDGTGTWARNWQVEIAAEE